jgi:hypothetical protein
MNECSQNVSNLESINIQLVDAGGTKSQKFEPQFININSLPLENNLETPKPQKPPEQI